MRVRRCPAVPRKVLAAVRHAGHCQPVNQVRCEHRDNAGIGMEGPIADDLAPAPVEVQHRSKAEIDAVGAQFSRQHVTSGRCHATRLQYVAVPQLAQAAHRRQACKAGPEALHPAAFVVDREQQRRVAQCCGSLRSAAAAVPELSKFALKRITMPTSGSTSRRRSEADSCLPSTPTTTGPSISCSPALRRSHRPSRFPSHRLPRHAAAGAGAR